MAFYTDQDPFVFLKVIKLRLDISHDSSSSLISVLQIYGVFYRNPEIGFKLFFLTDSCSQDLALQESD